MKMLFKYMISILITALAFVGSPAAEATTFNSCVMTATASNGSTSVAPDDATYKIATFSLGSGTFTVSSAASGCTVQYLVVAGGGSGGGYNSYNGGGGGGGGGVLSGNMSVSVQPYAVSVGAGGPQSSSTSGLGINGSNSTFSSLTALGGGAGGSGVYCATDTPGNGGSGGGAGGCGGGMPGGLGTAGQGYAGSPNCGAGSNFFGGGGGGAGAAGVCVGSTFSPSQLAGGKGFSSSITGSPVSYGGGGGGGAWNGATSTNTNSPGGAGGGGGGSINVMAPVAGTNGLGGGGGASDYVPGYTKLYGAAGGNGTVIVRYRFQNTPNQVTASGTVAATQSVNMTPVILNPSPGDTFTFSNPGASHGTVTIVGGQLHYVASAGFVGTDTFTFTATDSGGFTATGTATVTVTAYVPLAPASFVATQGTVSNAVGFTWVAAVGGSTYNIYSASTLTGTKALVQSGLSGTSYTLSTTNPSTIYYFILTNSASGGQSGYSTGVPGYPNDPPTSASASGSVMATQSVNMVPAVVDSTPGDSWTYSITSPAAYGTASVTGGQLHYVAGTNYTGVDTFTFLVTDSAGGTVTGTATVTVTPYVPSAPSVFSATQGTITNAVGFNWTSAVGGASYSIYSSPTLTGAMTLVQSGLTGTSYTLSTTNPAVLYYFIVTNSASGGQSSNSVGVTGYPNDPPTSASASGSVMATNSIYMTPMIVDTTPGDTWTYKITTTAAQGTASVIGGQLHYVAGPSYSGVDTFTFLVTDSAGGTVTGTATVTVTPFIPATPTNLAATDGTLNNQVGLAWDNQPNETYNLYSAATSTGTKTQIASGITSTTYSYSSTNPAVQFYYVTGISPSGGESPFSSAATGYPNLAPSSTTASATTTAATTVTFVPVTVDPNVGDVFTYAITSPPVSGQGSAAVSGASLIYTPDPGHAYTGTTTFGYTATDKGGLTVSGIATVVVNAEIPHGPTGVTATAGTITGAIKVSWMPQPNTVSYNLVEMVSGSPVTIATGITDVNYLVNVSDVSPHGYEVQGISASGGLSLFSSMATGYANEPPTATSLTIQTITSNGIGVVPQVTDPNVGDVFTFAIATQPSAGTATVVNNKIVYFSSNICVGTDSFTYTVTDKAGASITGQASVIGDCSPPTFTVSGYQETSPGSGILIDKQTGSYFAKLTVNEAPVGPVNITITNGGSTTTLTNVWPRSLRFLFNTPAGQPLWLQRTVTIHVAYMVNPTVFSEQSYQLVTVPNSSVMSVLLSGFPASINDTTTLSGNINIGKRVTGNMVYDPASQGDWQVKLDAVSSSNVMTDLTSYAETNNGLMNVSGISPVGYQLMRLVSVAKLVSPYPDYNVTVNSFQKVVTVTKGTPIVGSIAMPTLSGPAPIIERVKLTVDQVNQSALGAVQWLTSFNGGPFVPADPSTNNKGNIPMRFSYGTWQIKAVLTNKNSNVTSETNVLSVNAYPIPTITVSGLQTTMVGIPVTLTANVAFGDVAISDAIVEWSLKAPGDGQTLQPYGTGYSVVVTPSVEGMYQLVARARVANSDNSPVAYGSTTAMVKSMLNLQVHSTIAGPTRAEVDKPWIFTATILPPWGSLTTTATLQGQWVLPDGTTVPGTTLNWTPAVTDMKLLNQVVFQAWVTGFQSTTMLASTHRVSLWEYIWPSWRLVFARSSIYEPSNIKASLMMSDPSLTQMMLNEGVTYTWGIPDAVTNQVIDGNVMTGVASQAGTYNLTCTAADHRGNSQTATYSFTMDTPPPFVMSLEINPSNKYYKLPLTVNAKPTIKGGHPLDTPVTFNYTFNGTPLPGNTVTKVIPVTQLGLNSLHLQVLTKMGNEIDADASFTSITDTPPTCLLQVANKTNLKSFYFTADCSDTDGNVVKYAWTTNGILTQATGPLVTYNYASTPSGTVLTVELNATDDSGVVVTQTATVTVP